MGCDIHSHAEKMVDGKWQSVGLSPFDWRNYRMYGFLAGVRNYSAMPPIAERRGVPDDLSPEVRKDYESWGSHAHSASWLSLDELLNFDYDQPVEDRRVTRQTGPNSTADPGEGKMTTYREFLDEAFFADLEKLKAAAVDRVVFWFT